MTGNASCGREDERGVEDALARIHGRARTVRDRELERALSELDATGELSEDDREAVERLADRLVRQLLAVPTESLRAAAADDEEPTETAVELFG